MCGLLFEYDVQPSVKLYFAKFYMSIRTKRTAEKLSFFILLFIFGLVKPNFLLHKKQEKTEIFWRYSTYCTVCSGVLSSSSWAISFAWSMTDEKVTSSLLPM